MMDFTALCLLRLRLCWLFMVVYGCLQVSIQDHDDYEFDYDAADGGGSCFFSGCHGEGTTSSHVADTFAVSVAHAPTVLKVIGGLLSTNAYPW